MCSRTTYCIVIAYLSLACSCLCVMVYSFYLSGSKTQEVATYLDISVDIAQIAVAVCLMLSVISAVTAALLCGGIHERDRKLILPWLVGSAIQIGLYFIGTIVFLVTLKYPAWKCINFTISFVIQCVFTYPIYTFYKDIKDEN